MTPRDAAHAVRARLASQIADDRATLNRLAGEVRLLLDPSPDEHAEWMRGLALAFEIERYCTAVEAVLARVLRTVDGDVPSGPGRDISMEARSTERERGRKATAEIATTVR